MSATTTWKCPQDGMEVSLKDRKCPTCGYVNMPRCVTLHSDKTKKSARIDITTRLGRAVFKQRFEDEDAQFAADAQFEIVGPSGARTVPARDFLVSYFTTALRPDEILTGVRLALPNGRSGSCFLELSRRHGDFAIVGVGALLTLDGDGGVDDARLAMIGVGETAVRLDAAEQLLRGRRPTEEVLVEVAGAVEDALEPNGDLHASADYRRQVAGVLARRALATAATRARGGDGDDGA